MTIDGIRCTNVGEREAVGRVVLWIGVVPKTLFGKDAYNSASDCLDLLEEFDIIDVEVKYRESTYTWSAGPTSLNPFPTYACLSMFVVLLLRCSGYLSLPRPHVALRVIVPGHPKNPRKRDLGLELNTYHHRGPEHRLPCRGERVIERKFCVLIRKFNTVCRTDVSNRATMQERFTCPLRQPTRRAKARTTHPATENVPAKVREAILILERFPGEANEHS